jgi:hypothetical protein
MNPIPTIPIRTIIPTPASPSDPRLPDERPGVASTGVTGKSSCHGRLRTSLASRLGTVDPFEIQFPRHQTNAYFLSTLASPVFQAMQQNPSRAPTDEPTASHNQLLRNTLRHIAKASKDCHPQPPGCVTRRPRPGTEAKRFSESHRFALDFLPVNLLSF